MNKSYTYFYGKKRIVVVSLFSGIDIFMFAMTKCGMLPAYANEKILKLNLWHSTLFKHQDGTPVMEPYVVCTKDEYDYRKNHRDERGRKDREDEVWIIDGQYVRTKLIQEINGFDIRAAIEARYGKDVIIIVIGGPPCQGYTRLNTENNKYDIDIRNSLIFEYLRILKEVAEGGLVIGLMEEVPDFGQGKFKEIYDEFLKEAAKLPFRLGEQLICSLHCGGRQNRWRRVFQFVPEQLNTDPAFPKPDLINATRAGDFLDIEYFVMGGFDQLMRNKDHFVQTVTRGTPQYFFKDDVRRSPTLPELFSCQGIEDGEYPVPQYVPIDLQKLAIGNAVCKYMGMALGMTILNDVLKMKHIGDGYFVPINSSSDDPDSVNPTPPTPDPVIEQHVQDQPADKADVPLVTETTTDTTVIQTSTKMDVEPSLEVSEPGIKPEVATMPAMKSEILSLSAPAKPGLLQSKGLPGFGMSGVKLWQGPSRLNGEDVVAILTFESVNQKTGNMAQLWILPAGMDPLQAVKTGYDESICGSCSLRKLNQGGCYVEVAKAPSKVFAAWRNGAYPNWPVQYFSALGRYAVRYGAYGDPAAIPEHILAELKKHVTNYTAYTHQWRNDAAQELKPLCMASVESPVEQKEASAMGWRTFRIINKGDELAQDEILCPELTNGVQCVKCQLCKGTSRKAKNIAIYAHGALEKRFKAHISAATGTTGANSTIPLPEYKNKQHVNKSNPPGVNTSPVPVKELGAGKPLPPLRNLCSTDADFKKVDAPTIISSLLLRQMKFQSLNFEGPWGELLGLPSVNFHCIVHGQSGNGKSTFAIQFAKYVADSFGRVLYVSAEEGLFKTFQDKFTNNNAWSDSIDVAQIKTYDELIRIVTPDTYNFIFLDSLDTMKIDIAKLKKIKATFKNSALITISQSTKTGQMRGSNEIMHEGDVCVKVTDGIAETTKNRFQEKGTAFNVFQQMSDSEVDLDDEGE